MSTDQTKLKPPSGELADELETFRRQWKEDLRSQRPPTASETKVDKVDEASASKSHDHSNPGEAGPSVRSIEHRRRSSQARDGVRSLQALREQHVGHDDGIRSLDLDVKPPAVLGPGERSLTKKPMSTALEHYEAAVEQEKEGKVGESVNLYRKAFKMDASVHDQYKDKYFPRQSAPVKGQLKKSEVPLAEKKPDDKPQALLPTAELIHTLSSIPIIPGKEINLAALKGKASYRKQPTSPISTVPREILLHILSKLAEADLASFVRCATVCKALCYLVYADQQIWKTVCGDAYQSMIWGAGSLWGCDIKGKALSTQEDDVMDSTTTTDLPSHFSTLALLEENEEDEIAIDEVVADLPIRPYDDIEVLKYNSSYRTMFIERPRVRFNGVYISTCTYLRSGLAVNTNLTLSNTMHLVTYYRYLRFFPSGFVLTLLTPSEPTDVVHALTLENYNHLASTSTTTTHPASAATVATALAAVKNMLPGRWRMLFNPLAYTPSSSSADEPGGRIQIEAEGSGTNSRYINTLDLTLKMRPKGVAGRRGYGDRLSWNSYTSWNRLTDDRGVYSLKNDKPFYFSRVKAYERENVATGQIETPN
ncbi:hypothetical protein Dda_3808 [Drechslerella dactyloides]|uniref:F-box domain-containing protein n=1 Tax=Drechslerella dactyloides TaxID=74499 RepID=A0AAD6NK44_DREDA|nr:hypothetical protein Dda_3808 [Drechslerella dactyloides]